MRCFISVELPEEIRRRLNGTVKKLKEAEAEVKWVGPDNLHLTLKFLGWVEDRDLEKLVSICEKEASKFAGFELGFEGLGTFPEGKTPRVIWAGAQKGQAEMKEIAEALEKALSQAGFRSEEREFKSHATLGRVKGKKGVDRLKLKIKELGDPEFGECRIEHIHIMKSTLTPKGPIYETYKKIKLKDFVPRLRSGGAQPKKGLSPREGN